MNLPLMHRRLKEYLMVGNKIGWQEYPKRDSCLVVVGFDIVANNRVLGGTVAESCSPYGIK